MPVTSGAATPLTSRPLGSLGERVADVRRIALLRANSIGDFVLSLPALDALRSAYPEAQLTVLGAAWHQDALANRPGPWTHVIAVPPYPGLSGQVPNDATPGLSASREFFDQQQRCAYDLAVQLHGGGARSNPFVAELGARVTVGACDDGVPPLDRCIHYSANQHETLRCLEVVAQVGAVPVTLEPRLTVVDEDRAAAAAALPRSERPVVVLHPGANDPRRRWSPERFATVARSLVADGCDVVVVGAGADDECAAERILRAGPPAAGHHLTSLVGSLSFSALLGVLEGATLVVSNDSGPRHLAAAVGTATVSVYWVGNLLTAGPLSRDRQRALVSYRAGCPVCGEDQTDVRCPHDESFVDDVPADAVLAQARSLLG
jgi:ADP-heptose:LPS heptosyltransferase